MTPFRNASVMSLLRGVPSGSTADAASTRRSHGMPTIPPPYVEIGTSAPAIGKVRAVFSNWVRKLPVNSPCAPSTVKILPAVSPNFGLRNCVNVAFTSALDGSVEGKSRAVFGGTRAPVSGRILSPNALRPTTFRKPPGQRPAFCVSTLSVYSELPQKWAPVWMPPVATACGVRMKSRSSTMPFLPISSRSPPQLPVSRGRESRSPPQVSGTGMGCARPVTGATSSSPSAPIHPPTLISPSSRWTGRLIRIRRTHRDERMLLHALFECGHHPQHRAEHPAIDRQLLLVLARVRVQIEQTRQGELHRR